MEVASSYIGIGHVKRAYRVAKVIKGNLKGTNVKGKVTSRGGFRKNTVQNAWDNAKNGPSGGKLCPTCNKEVKVKLFLVKIGIGILIIKYRGQKDSFLQMLQGKRC